MERKPISIHPFRFRPLLQVHVVLFLLSKISGDHRYTRFLYSGWFGSWPTLFSHNWALFRLKNKYSRNGSFNSYFKQGVTKVTGEIRWCRQCTDHQMTFKIAEICLMSPVVIKFPATFVLVLDPYPGKRSSALLTRSHKEYSKVLESFLSY